MTAARWSLPVLGLLAGLLPAQDPAPRPNREATWPAPTAEDWARPVLVHFQRTWEDAQAVSKETGKPLLVCVNMDGEIASEHYAGVRYRQPEIAALYEQYVCVIASVYRHNARDYDEEGRRIPCPRFGSVTCGEHIAIEPLLYAQYFEGQRIAPRHVGVEQDGRESYDVFYAYSTEAVFDAVRKGLEGRPPPVTRSHSELTALELVSSRDSADRAAVEAEWERADHDRRRALLEAAAAQGRDVPVDLLRLALLGPDADLAATARAALAQSSSPAAVDLIVRALGVSVEVPGRQALLTALDRLGEATPRARTLAVAYRGLSGPSTVLDVAAWSRALDEGPPPPDTRVARAARLEAQNEILGSDDASAHVELAEALLAQAGAEPDPKEARLLDRDAQRVAREALALGAYGPRLDAVLAVACFDLGELDEARARAPSALSTMPRDPRSRDALVLLTLFAQSRQEAIARAVRDKTDWPASWLADVHAAWDVLARHPLGNDAQVLMHHDFLRWFGATAEASAVLDEGLQRFPGSWDLHDRLRARVLEERGVGGLEPEYERRLAAPDAPAGLESFAGYASLVAAEYHRRAGRPDAALAAYERGIAHYERAIAADPDARAVPDHYVALALAGRARVAFERGDDARAVDELLASFARRPDAAATLDGLSISAVDTARLLQARLTARGDVALATRVQEALATLDPEMLRPPVFERNQPGEAAARNRSGTRTEQTPPRQP